MAIGIIVCGLNGAGKSTLGRALASALHLHFIDKEDLVFPGGHASGYYAAPRSRGWTAKSRCPTRWRKWLQRWESGLLRMPPLWID